MSAAQRRWIWSLLALLGIALALQVLVRFPWRETFAALTGASRPLLLLAMVINWASPFAKGAGWYVVLRRLAPCRFWPVQEANLVGTAATSLSVGLTGEAARVGVIVRREGLPTRVAVWSIAATRAAEGVALAWYLILAPFVLDVPPAVRSLQFLGAAIILGLVVLNRTHRWRWLADHLPATIRASASEVAAAAAGRRLLLPAAFGMVSWAAEWATYHAVLTATIGHVSWSASFVALIAANLGGLLRLTPANLGVMQAAIVAALLPFDVSIQRAVAAGLALEAIQVLPILALAAIVLYRSGYYRLLGRPVEQI
jgi:uncharacterized membrane protein YbhN (UPF0104 family)